MSPETFQLGIQQFNQKQFYQCHDTLEAIWIEAPEMDKRFYQGILQVAVACHHLSNLNIRGAIILLGEGIRRLNDYQPDYYGIDVDRLLDEAITLLQTLQQLDSEEVDSFVEQLFSISETRDSTDKSCELPQLHFV